MSKLTSLEKALCVLDAVAKARSIGLRELAAELGFPAFHGAPSLSLLTACHYLTQDPKTKKYRLSLKFLELGAAVRDDLGSHYCGSPHMTALNGSHFRNGESWLFSTVRELFMWTRWQTPIPFCACSLV